MKKKILASLLAVCMLAGLAVPAFAVNAEPYGYSSEAGELDEITALEFSEKEITIKNGGEANLLDYLTAYCGDKKIALDMTGLDWSISDSLAFGLYETTVSNIGEDSGTATITVKVPEKDITASVNVKAAKGDADPVIATGFKFSSTKYTANTSPNEIEIKVVPTNGNAYFAKEQSDLLVAKMQAEADRLVGTTARAASTDIFPTGYIISEAAKVNDDNNAVTVKFKAPDKNTTAKAVTFALNDIELPRYDRDGALLDKAYTKVSRTAKITVNKSVAAKKVVRTKSIKIEVGQVAKLDDCIAFTSGATYNNSVNWSLDYYNDNYDTTDYALYNKNDDGNWVLGVAVGKLKAVAEMEWDDAEGNTIPEVIPTAVVPIEVVARGTLATEKKYTVTPETASPKVGEKVELTLKDEAGNVVEGVTWSVSDGKLATITVAANPTTFNAKAEGKVLVFARVGEDVVATATITIVGDGSTVTPPPSGNPGTGDSLFANLF